MIKLYVFNGGDIICRDIAQLNSTLSTTGEKELANPVYLIHHPKGLLFWDSGLSDDLIHQKEGVEPWIFHLSLKKTLLSQLEEIGVQPADIDYFAFSHVHLDHTGNANYFKTSTLIMQEKEYNIAFNKDNKPFNYSDYQDLESSEAIKLNGDYDLFGDGSVQFISTPGHTPGHQSLLVNLKETGPILISGDICYYQESFQQKGVAKFNSSYKESLSSIEKIRTLMEHTKAQLWVQHDKDQYDSLKHSPLFYQ